MTNDAEGRNADSSRRFRDPTLAPPLYKRNVCLPRRRDITVEHFHTHWSTVHRAHALAIRRLQRYVQLHRIEADVPGLTTAPFDGIAENWFDAPALAAGISSDPDYVNGAAIDEAAFIDLAGRVVLAAYQLVVVQGEPPPEDDAVKAVLMVRLRDQSPAAIDAYIARRAAMVPDLVPGLRRYALGPVDRGERPPEGQPRSDAAACGIVEDMWWENRATFDHAAPQLGRLGPEADAEHSLVLVGRELRVIWPPLAGSSTFVG